VTVFTKARYAADGRKICMLTIIDEFTREAASPRRMAHSTAGHPLRFRYGYAGVRLNQDPVPPLDNTRLR
jgi:hypothetical protein